MNRVGNPLHGSHMKRSGPVPSDVVAWASSAPGQGTRLELERKASQEPLPKQGLREILPLTVEQLEPEMSLQTPGLPFMQMTGQIAQGWLLPTTFPKWEDGVGVQLPKREQENPPGEPYPKDAKWLCTGLASKECFHLPGRLQPSEPPHSFRGRATMRPPILFPIKAVEPEAERLVLGKPCSLRPETGRLVAHLPSSPLHGKHERTREGHLYSVLISLTSIISVSPTSKAVRSNSIAWKPPCREKKIFFPL